MFKIGEYVVYGHNGVCQVTEIGPLKTVTKDEGKLYYTLIPYGVKGSTVFAPVDSQKLPLRRILSREEALALIDEMQEIAVLGGAAALRGRESSCIKCAKCVSACPMGLEPYLMAKLSRRKLWERLEAEWVTNCIECGCCQFTCPADIPLLDFIRMGKQEVGALIRARAAAHATKK